MRDTDKFHVASNIIEDLAPLVFLWHHKVRAFLHRHAITDYQKTPECCGRQKKPSRTWKELHTICLRFDKMFDDDDNVNHYLNDCE